MSNGNTPGGKAKDANGILMNRKTQSERIEEYAKLDLNGRAFQSSNKVLKENYAKMLKDLTELDRKAQDSAQMQELEKMKEEIKRAAEQNKNQKAKEEKMSQEMARLRAELSGEKCERVEQVADEDINTKKLLHERENEIELSRTIIHEKATENDGLIVRVTST